MGLTTNLSGPPTWDDYDPTKDYVKILFQPGVSVQTRELNQLQTLFQAQIERFGDNIFKQGTIVSGCNFIFYPNYPYVKILDNEVSGATATLSKYKGQFATCQSSGLSAQILDTVDGFESLNPDLKTLYLRYTNSGNDGNTAQFSTGDILTIEDQNDSIWSVTVTAGGTGFSNTDSVVFVPRLIVNVASGSFANGDYVMNNLGANAQIIGIDTTTYANASQIVLTVKPLTSDLANPTSTANAWSISPGQAITNQSNTVAARCEGSIGFGARATPVTDTVGRVKSIAVLFGGQKYSLAPYVTMKSANNSAGINALNFTALNYIGQVKVASVAASVGNGYAFGVSEGVIYQKGYFLRAAPQTIIVDKYSTQPDQLAVGFTTSEVIVDSNIDQSLLDNAQGTPDVNAPGASRLQLTPSLTLLSKTDADANADFFTIVEWSEGNPFKQNQYTAYNKIEDEMATIRFETEGNYIVDSFLMSTRSPIDSTLEGNTYSVVIDPGIAYIGGKRIQTITNFAINTPKCTNTLISNSHSINLNYGNYIQITQVAGVFQFNTGDVINLYDTAKTFLANGTTIAAGITPAGTQIGTARMRSMTLASGTPGRSDAVYNLYLFNVQMNAGKNFRQVKSVYYNNTFKGIGDVVLTLDGTTNSNIAVMQSPNTSVLLFPTGVDSLLNANQCNYTYRTIDQTLTVSNTGTAQKSISAIPNEFYPYTGSLTAGQMTDLYVVPTAIDLPFANAITGTVSVNTTSANVTGTGTNFATDLAVGDYVYAEANSTVFSLHRVVNIVNSTFLQLGSPPSFTNTTASVVRVFPAQVPIPFGSRSGLSANVDVNQQVLTLNFGTNFAMATSANIAVGVNINRVNVTQASKAANRHGFVKIALSNNAGNTVGPWCVGVPDIFRLRGVYVGNSTVSNTGTNQISSFYVDHNQNPDFLDLGWLFLAPKASVQLNSNNYLLVEFDYFTTGSGFVDPVSYVSANVTQRVLVDSQPLSNLTTSISSWEVPEVFDDNGNDYDLLQYFDFRPIAANTVAVGTTPGTAPVNPSNTTSFGNTASSANEKRFPLPGSAFTCNMEQFIGRTDSVIITSDGNIEVLNGKPDPDVNKQFAPTVPANAMKMTDLVVPAYPSIPIVRGVNINEIVTTYVMNGRYLKVRTDTRAITKPRSQAGSVFDTPKVYTMADIGQIDRRLQDVEYYVSLNMLESNVAALAIPSSINPALDRFKYGFFADDLSTYAFSDRENPTYAAYIEDNAAVPEKLTWDMYLNGAIGAADYVDFLVVNQDNATWPDTLGPVCILQYVTYDVQVINGQYYLNTGTPGVAPTPIDPKGLIGVG